LFPVPTVFVAYPFYKANVQKPKNFPHFAHSELAVVVYPAPYFEPQQFRNPADGEMYPTMEAHLRQLSCYPCYALLADGRAKT
jgi:hypothetical protein